MIPDGDHRAPRTRIRPAPFSLRWFALQVLILAAVATGLLYLASWIGNLLGAGLGALAAFCLYLPVFGWFEYRQDAQTVDRANGMMESHAIATDAFIQRRLDGTQEWLLKERQEDAAMVVKVLAERDALEQRLLPFVTPRQRGDRGRFITSKPQAPKRIRGKGAFKTVLTSAPNSQPENEGSSK